MDTMNSIIKITAVIQSLTKMSDEERNDNFEKAIILLQKARDLIEEGMEQ